MKNLTNALAKFIYSLLYFIDSKLQKLSDYSYETAPYCGHHYNGHKGYFTQSSYHEGMGGCSASFLCFWVYKNTEEADWDMGISKPKYKLQSFLYVKNGAYSLDLTPKNYGIKGLMQTLKDLRNAKSNHFRYRNMKAKLSISITR
jgi:hypothetical protein